MSETTRVKKVIHDETRWCVIGPDGGVDFHCSDDAALTKLREIVPNIDRIGGLEVHRRQPADYQKGREASFEHCWLLDGPCWCDGSSLYASEVLIPIYERGDEEALWRQLEYDYRRHFEEVNEPA